MKKIFMLSAIFSAGILGAQIAYELPYSNTYVFYSNQVSSVSLALPTYNEPYIQSNRYISELPLYAFTFARLYTNEEYTGKSFSCRIMAVDQNGRHVTITSPTNVSLHTIRPPLSAGAGSLSADNIRYTASTVNQPDIFGFIPPQSIIYPDYAGRIFINSFNAPAYMTIVPGEKKILTNRVITAYDGLNGTFTIVTNVLTNTHTMFLENSVSSDDSQPFAVHGINARYSNLITASSGTTPVRIYLRTEATNGILTDVRDITSEFSWSNKRPSHASLSGTGSNIFVSPGTEGIGIIHAKNTSAERNQFSTNILFLIGVEIANKYSLRSKNFVDEEVFSIEVPAGTFKENVYFDARRPEHHTNVYTVTNYNPALSNSSYNSSLEEIKLFANCLLQAGAYTISNVLKEEGLEKPVVITLSYDEKSLEFDKDYVFLESSIQVFRLSAGKWETIETQSIIDTVAHTVQFSTSVLGLFSLGAVTTHRITDIRRVEAYPNPFIAQGQKKMRFINLPEDFTSLEIFSLSSKRVKCFSSRDHGEAILENKGLFVIEWDGCDDAGNPLPGGLYYFAVGQNNQYKTQKFVIIR